MIPLKCYINIKSIFLGFPVGKVFNTAQLFSSICSMYGKVIFLITLHSIKRNNEEKTSAGLIKINNKGGRLLLSLMNSF